VRAGKADIENGGAGFLCVSQRMCYPARGVRLFANYQRVHATRFVHPDYNIFKNSRTTAAMDFQILDYRGADKDAEIASLLTRVFVGEGYTDKSAQGMFAVAKLRKHGEIMLALSSGELWGMIIFVPPASPARQVAKPNEAEIHLLAVDPKTRDRGIASSLVMACEQRTILSGYSSMVLSTQPTMKEAQRLYEPLGYRRNAARDWSRGARTYLVYEKPLK
jgi:ribosomal protein S18 acetylase RimI-like enzyme